MLIYSSQWWVWVCSFLCVDCWVVYFDVALVCSLVIKIIYAPIAQWIERRLPTPGALVRFQLGAPRRRGLHLVHDDFFVKNIKIIALIISSLLLFRKKARFGVAMSATHRSTSVGS